MSASEWSISPSLGSGWTISESVSVGSVGAIENQTFPGGFYFCVVAHNLTRIGVESLFVNRNMGLTDEGVFF